MVSFLGYISFSVCATIFFNNMTFRSAQDVHSSAWFAFLCTTRWFGILLDWISAIYIAAVVYSFMAGSGKWF